MTFTLVHASDPHLGDSGGPARAELGRRSWAAFREYVNRTGPDLVVVTGDLVVDDADDEADHETAERLLSELEVPYRVVPGNHDVGDHVIRTGLPADWHGKPVSSARISAWERRWGRSYWRSDFGPWRIVGVNSQAFGSGTRHEHEQWGWLRHTALPDDGPAVVFLHESLGARPEPVEPENWMSVPTAASQELEQLFRRAGVRLVGSGHTHRHSEWTLAGIRQVTAPSLAGPIPVRADMVQPFGDGAPGWLSHRLFDNGTVEITRHTASVD